MSNTEIRAHRQSSRFSGMDLHTLQTGVHRNIQRLLLSLDGRYMDLLDLMNFLKNGRRHPLLTPENVSQYYSLAHAVTLNGIYLYQYMHEQGYDPIVIQNYALSDLPSLLDHKPFAACISSNFIFMDDIRDMAIRIKEYSPETYVIVGGMLVKKVLDGGPILSSRTKDLFSTFHGRVDAFIIESQGEQTLARLFHALRRGEDLGAVPNLALFDDQGKIFFTVRRSEDMQIDRTAIAWDKIPKPYLRKTLPVNSSRGCFYRCRFCTYHWLFPEVCYKSIDVIGEELRLIRDLGFVRHIRFTDDNFTANKARLKTVLEMIIREKFDFSWSSFARASALTPELVGLMKTAGCEFVDLGLESGSQIILDNMDKRLSRQQSLDAIRMLNDSGIYARGSFIIGFPGETRETFKETVEFINESSLPYYHPYLFYYSTNTLVHEDRTDYGLRGLGLAWTHHTMDSLEASNLMSQMPRLIPRSYTDGQNYVEEIYKFLRGEGYSPDEILELFKLKRELQMEIEASADPESGPTTVNQILERLESLVEPSNCL